MKRTGLTILTTVIILSANAQLIGNKEVAFTQNKKMEYEYNNFSMADVLFYISAPILMKRELPKTKDVAYNPKGRVAFENGKAYEYYELVDGASCKFESESDDKKTVSMRFGIDADETLLFNLQKGIGGDENLYYTLVVGDDKNISFLGYKWDLLSNGNVRLNIKEKKNSKVDIDKTKSKGIKMDGTERKGILKKNN